MKRFGLICLAALYAALPARAVTCQVYQSTQFSNSSGAPLAAGLIYVTLAGTTTPATSYTSSSCATPATNPVVMNSGGYFLLWLDVSVVYRLTIRNSAGTLIQTIDGLQVGGGGGGGGGGSNQWTTTGSAIYNNNAGNVGIGTASPLEKLGVVGNMDLQGIFKLRNSDSTSYVVGQISPNGMAGDYIIQWPTALPGSTSCLQSSTTGVMTWLAGCSGGSGTGGAANYTQSFTGQTTVALTHNLNSATLIVECYNAGVEIPSADYTSKTNTSLNTFTVVFMGAKTGYCIVNSSAGNPNIWTRDGSSNITLTDSATAVSQLKIANQTAATGVTRVDIYEGPGNDAAAFPLNHVLNVYDQTATIAAYIDNAQYFVGTGFIAPGDGTAGKVLLGIGGLYLASSAQTIYSSTAAFDGTPDLCSLRISAGLLGIQDCSGSYRDLHLRNITIDGTCTGAGCGGGGVSLPVVDSTALVYSGVNSTRQLRLDVQNVPNSTLGVLTVQSPGTYTVAATNLAQTFTQDQTIQAQLNFNILSGSLAWKLGTNTANTLEWRNSSSALRMYLVDNGFAPIGGGGATLVAPSVLAQATATNSPSLMALAGAGQSADIFVVEAVSLSGKYLYTTAAGYTNVLGASSGTLYPFVIRDSGSSAGLNLYTATNTKQATYSAGATSAFAVQNQADLFRFIVFQNGNVQINQSADQGRKFFVNGDANINGPFSAVAGSGSAAVYGIGTTVPGGFFTSLGTPPDVSLGLSSNNGIYARGGATPAGTACANGNIYLWTAAGAGQSSVFGCKSSVWTAIN